MKAIFAAAALAFGFASGGASAAVTTSYFTTDGPDNQTVVDFGDFTVTASSDGILNFCGATVTQTSSGLGVNGCPDTQGDQIDGFPYGSSERLTFDFKGNMAEITEIDFRAITGSDEYELFFDGSSYAVSSDDPWAGSVTASNFAIQAKSMDDACEYFFWLGGCDDFKVKSITYELVSNPTTVPLPASGLLLVAGLGGLMAARRKRSA